MSGYKEERKAREITRKITEEIGKLETKIKNVRELKIDIVEHDYDKLIFDLNVEKRFGIEKGKKIEIKLEKLKISKTIVGTSKK